MTVIKACLWSLFTELFVTWAERLTVKMGRSIHMHNLALP